MDPQETQDQQSKAVNLTGLSRRVRRHIEEYVPSTKDLPVDEERTDKDRRKSRASGKDRVAGRLREKRVRQMRKATKKGGLK